MNTIRLKPTSASENVRSSMIDMNVGTLRYARALKPRCPAEMP